MKEESISIETILILATALEEINDKVIYVGGAAISLYVEETYRDSIRPTEDIDIVLEIATFSELENLRIELSKKGIKQSHEDEVVCRFRYKGIKVDVMATKEIAWAPANKWFEKGFKNLQTITINGINIQILTFPYFLATKFEAYNNRGKTDARTSKDFEDIVFLLNNVKKLHEKIREADEELQQFLKNAFKNILESTLELEALRTHLSYESEDDRFDIIISKLKSL